MVVEKIPGKQDYAHQSPILSKHCHCSRLLETTLRYTIHAFSSALPSHVWSIMRNVKVHVYDLSHGLARSLSMALLGKQVRAFVCSLVVVATGDRCIAMDVARTSLQIGIVPSRGTAPHL